MNRPPRERSENPWIAPAVVAALTFVVFLPALRNGFVSWDDAKNFLDNPHYRGLGATQLGWMWTTFHLGHYVPLTWMTLGLDYVVWGMNPLGYHLTSVLIHAANAVLVYLVAQRFLRGSDRSPLLPAFAALVFAMHPLRVESVAWVTERRDVLSLFFALLSLLAWLESRAESDRARRWYWSAVALFACALLSKATVMTLPAVLVVIAVWQGERSAKALMANVWPFALLSFASVVLSIVALKPPPQLGIPAKIAVSAWSLCFYLWKTVAPMGLSPLYEMPTRVNPFAPIFFVSALGVIALLALMWWLRTRQPGATALLLLFIIVSLPMLGVVQNGPQIAADRYTYHSAPVLAVLAAALLGILLRRSTGAAIIVGSMVLVACGTLTWTQNAVWHDSESLWTQALAVDSESAVAHSAYAALLYQENRVDDAMLHSQQAALLAPDYPEARNNLGIGFARQGKAPLAIEQYQRAIELKPSYDEAQSNWGVALAQQGDVAGAINHYEEALRLNPDFADAHVNWGNALVRANKLEEAIPHYQAAVVIRPDHADAQLNWGVALARGGNLTGAINHFQLALAANPNLAEARTYLDAANRLLSAPR